MTSDFSKQAAATAAASLALQTALLKSLVIKGVLTRDDAFAVIDNALLSIEEQQGSAPHIADVLGLARQMIEAGLPPKRVGK